MGNETLIVNLEQDLNEITKLIWAYMDAKYIKYLKKELDGFRVECNNNLGKEAQLMRAMIPFAPEASKILQFIVDAMVYNDMIERSFEKHQELAVLYRDENSEMEKVKKLMYKLILFKLITTIEKGGID